MHNFSLYQLLVPAFGAIMLLRAVSQASQGNKTARELITIFLFWLFLSLVSLFPSIFIDKVAAFLGIRSGINALFFFGFVILFYTVFRLLIAQEESQEKITKIIRTIALKDLDNEHVPRNTKH